MDIGEKQKFIDDRVMTAGNWGTYDLDMNKTPYNHFYFENIDVAINCIKYIEENLKGCRLTVKKGYIMYKRFCILVIADSKESLDLIRLVAA